MYAETKKPIYKKWWFWVLLFFCFCMYIIGNSGNGTINEEDISDPEIESIEGEVQKEKVINQYTEYKYVVLIDEFDENPMRAERNHEDEHVKINGSLAVIDSDGEYFTINNGENDYEYYFKQITCYVRNKETKDKLIDFNIGDEITIYGKIVKVSELTGYSINIDDIE